MSERDDRYARNDLPSSTAEFRATPDPSASTAEFKAFAAGRDTRAERSPSSADAWPEQPWAGEEPVRGSRRTAALAVGAIIIVALIITIIVLVG